MSNIRALNLFYWVRGQPLCNINHLSISPDTTIKNLKKHIAQQLPFREYHAPSATRIYKIPEDTPVFNNSHLEDILASLSVFVLGDPLRSIHTLSSIFVTQPPESQLHLIVDIAHSYFVRCWFRNANFENFHGISIPKTHKIDDLRHSIVQIRSRLPNAPDFVDLKLYTALHLTDEDFADILKTVGKGQLLNGIKPLGTIFDAVPFSATPRVIADLIEQKDNESNPDAQIRTEDLIDVKEKKPSGFSGPSRFEEEEKGKGKPKLSGRRPVLTLPVELLHPVLAQFIDDCRTLTVKDYPLADHIKKVMSQQCNNAAQRMKAFNKALKGHGIHLQAIEAANIECATNAYISVNEHCSVVAQFKMQGAEPVYEAVRYYLQSTRRDAPKYPGSPVPCLVLDISGSIIFFGGFSRDLLPTRPKSSLLIETADYLYTANDREALARYMAAFRKAVSALNKYYRALQKTSASVPKSPPHLIAPRRSKTTFQSKTTSEPRQPYPYQTSYKRRHEEKVEIIEFQYDEAVKNKLVYFGTEVKSNERICIKFCQRYSKEAHNCMASLGHAPVLRAMEAISDDWVMIVFDGLTDFETLADRKYPLSPSVFNSISETLHNFHAAGFVHGDIRDVNIMVSKTDEKFMFVDFDWAGKIGRVEYPALVNNVTIMRPAGVTDAKLISEKHDVFMLNQLDPTNAMHMVHVE